jgi:translation initiation factor eIF-2B subunit alpha
MCVHLQRVIVHSHSRVVLETLRSVPENIHFTVYIVSSALEESYNIKVPNIEVVYIPDAEVGTRMETIDMVLVGAEAVVKNGGIINRVRDISLNIHFQC